MDVTIKNCNNIKKGNICIEKNKLNIKYGINGTGKSTMNQGTAGCLNQGTDFLFIEMNKKSVPWFIEMNKKSVPWFILVHVPWFRLFLLIKLCLPVFIIIGIKTHFNLFFI